MITIIKNFIKLLILDSSCNQECYQGRRCRCDVKLNETIQKNSN